MRHTILPSLSAALVLAATAATPQQFRDTYQGGDTKTTQFFVADVKNFVILDTTSSGDGMGGGPMNFPVYGELHVGCSVAMPERAAHPYSIDSTQSRHYFDCFRFVDNYSSAARVAGRFPDGPWTTVDGNEEIEGVAFVSY